ncbi:MAG: hypothetical protein QXN55_01770 [Candidatus Nitrosotenuis sp.]
MRINGNITLNNGGQGEVQNFVIERLTTAPTVSSSEKGRIYFNTVDNIYYYNNGTSWMAFATGGNATALQNEVDYLESSLGTSVNADGTFNSAAFSGYAAGATSVTDAINKLQLAMTAHNTFAELDDVNVLSATSGQIAMYNGGTSKWDNHTLVLADVSDVTSTASEVNQLHTSGVVTADLVKLHAVTSSAAELNILTGATLSTTELNYVDGVTSAIQTQLDNKQPLDAQLTSIASLLPTTNDILVGTVTGEFSLQNGAGARSALGLVIGTNVQAWDADLDTIAAFAPAADSSESITINTTVINHTGLNDFMVGTGGAEGARWTLERGATARTSLGLGDIAIMDEQNFIRADVASSNVAANITWNNYKITNLAPGTAGTDAINFNQLQAAIAGLSWKNSVKAATTANVDVATGGTLTVDGVALIAGDRVLVKNQTVAAENGIYVVAAGTWARSTDFDDVAEINGAAVYVEGGTLQADTGWTVTSSVTTLGTDDITFVQFNGASGITAGVGLSKVGNQIDVNLGAGIVELPGDEVGIDLYDPTTSAIILTTDATTRSTATNAKLHLLLDLTGNGKLVQSANGLKLTTNTVTEAELTASVAGNGLTGGNGTALAVVSHTGTGSTGGDTPANWAGVGVLTVTADSVGVTLGSASTEAAPGNHVHKASAITFSNAVTGGTATDVQGALEYLDGRTDTLESNGTALQSEVDAIEAAVGLQTSGALNSWSGTNYVDGSTTFKAAVTALDTAVKSLDTQVNNRIASMYYLYTGAAATSHTVTHNLNQKYCNVTICDSADEVIIPQSIVFNNTTTLTITFNVAVAIKAVVMGLS